MVEEENKRKSELHKWLKSDGVPHLFVALLFLSHLATSVLTIGMTVNTKGINVYKRLIDSDERWRRKSRLVKLNLWVLLYVITATANGYDGSMMSGFQLLDQWEQYFDHPTGSKLGLLGAIQTIGSLGSIPVAPYASDFLGRRGAVMMGASTMIAGAALQTAAQNVDMFIGARALLGFGLGFCNNAGPLMVMELAYPPQRAPIGGVYNSIYNLGAIVAAWATFGTYFIRSTWAWRLPALLQVIPSIIQVCLVMFGPESPRWLMGHGREKEAFDTLVYYHGCGDPHNPLVVYEFEEIKAAIEHEIIQKQTGWKDLFATKGMLRRVRLLVAIPFFSQWSGSGLISYYLSPVLNTVGITNQIEKLLINCGLSMWSFVCGFFGGLMADIAGRRTLFLVSTAGMFFAFILQTICSAEFAIHGSKGAGSAVVAWIFLYNGFYALAWSPISLLYITEIVPFSLRAKGHSIFAICNASSQVFNQYANPIALAALAWKYYIVYDVIIVLVFVFMYIYCIETKGLTLEETAILFDGLDAVATLEKKAGERLQIEGGHRAVSHADSLEKASTTEHFEVVNV